MFLGELQRPVSTLKGVGKSFAVQLKSLGIESVGDLLRFYPVAYEDRKGFVSLSEGGKGHPVNTVCQVLGHSYIGRASKKILKVRISDGTGEASLVCFGRNYLGNLLRPGCKFHLYGVFAKRFGRLEASNFEVEMVNSSPVSFGKILAKYALKGRLRQKKFRRFLDEALKVYLPLLEEELPKEVLIQRKLAEKKWTMKMVHCPESFTTLRQARERLIYEEFFFLHLLLAENSRKNDPFFQQFSDHSKQLVNGFIQGLPFKLTGDQTRVIAEIRVDMESRRGMTRLLQGEVGSGKTLVALISALFVIGEGEQVAFMAPTELLARQHWNTVNRLLTPLGIRVSLLVGSLKESECSGVLREIEEGEVDLVVGTHALFSEKVKFAQLRFAIIDEQQRFGVIQRSALLSKGKYPDLLLVTATPIPRTLALCLSGSLTLSTLHHCPPERGPTETHLAKEKNIEKVYDFVRTQLHQGHQVYFVYPLIEQSEREDLRTIEGYTCRLQQKDFPGYKLGVIHSRVKEKDGGRLMEQFAHGEIDILVATTVLEVGIDVPNATIIVVHNAERFGLSTLHQLRGRVGRGMAPSYAFFVYGETLTEEAKRRLRAIKETAIGFEVAEEDLKIRGYGSLIGVEQSGFHALKVGDVVRDQEIFLSAYQDAQSLLKKEKSSSALHKGFVETLLRRASPFFLSEKIRG